MNKVTINPCWDMESLRVVSHGGQYEYAGPWVYCKGDTTAQSAEVAQAGFDQQLMGMMQAQYGRQSAITSYLTNLVQPQITSGGQGMTPAALSAARTGATDTISQQYQDAQRQVNAGMNRSLPSGVNAQISGKLASSAATDIAGAQNQITSLNEQLKQQNYWNSINVLNGQAATENPLGYANAATSGSGAVSNLSQAYTASNQSQLLGALGGVVGGTLQGWATGGFKT